MDYGLTMDSSWVTTAVQNFFLIGAVLAVVSAMIGIRLVPHLVKTLFGLAGRR